MPMSKLDDAIIEWDAEVDEETIKLIKMGLPPYIAREGAISKVSSRRRMYHADKSGG